MKQNIHARELTNQDVLRVPKLLSWQIETCRVLKSKKVPIANMKEEMPLFCTRPIYRAKKHDLL